SSEAGDRSLWWGSLKRGGERKVADRLVHNLKDAMHSDKGIAVPVASNPKPSPPPPTPADVPNQPPTPASTTRKLTVKSHPDRAEIEIDGNFAGNAPTTLQVAAGSHRVVVKNNGEVWERSLQVAAGDSITVKAPVAAKNTQSAGSQSAVNGLDTVAKAS